MKHIKHTICIALICMTFFASAETESISDTEVKERIVRYIAPKCSRSRNQIDLVDTYYINGDTNRLLRILSDLVVTNDEWICTRSMCQYGKYAGRSELPFLYSCATNPMCGEFALSAILRIDGVSTNSLNALNNYISITNAVAVSNNTYRLRCCRDYARLVFSDESLVDYRARVAQIILNFARSKNAKYINADKLLCEIDESYVNSRRRLATMRVAVSHGLNEMQTNYVYTIIQTLESYPESNLPD